MCFQGTMIRTIFRAKYVLTEPELLLQNAAVYVSDPGRISRIEPWQNTPRNPETVLMDWGSAVIVPGLINAHTHLELTGLHNQLTQFTSFTDWIKQLINKRRLWTQEDFYSSVKEGARLSLLSGTTTVGDITASRATHDALRGANLRRVIFDEILSLSPDTADTVMAQISPACRPENSGQLQRQGISPHAPYSVSADLFRRAAAAALAQDCCLAVHAAETLPEIRFLLNGYGEFREFLSSIGALPPDWQPPGLAPIPYLNSLGVLGPRCLLIHCNYLDQDSIARILNSRSSVVYCPRSHDFFGHRNHPIRQLLDSGINTALGTDSLASNSSLSMIDEMRFLFKQRKDLKAEEIFRAATLNGAAALGSGGTLGRLRRGYWADMTILEVPPELGPRQLLNQILEGAGECIGTIVQGRIAWQR
jgi:aminodeoxyfutalosine deaminase